MVKFSTSYWLNGQKYGSHIFAENWDEAEKFALVRGIGEAVDGILEDTDVPVGNLMHRACFAGWLSQKNMNVDLLSDQGLLHEIIHLETGVDGDDVTREQLIEKLEQLEKSVFLR